MSIAKDKLADMYEKMMLTRTFEETAAKLFTQGKVHGTAHFCIGEEATGIGVCAALEPQDQIYATHRGHGQSIGKGMDVKRMMAEFLGKATGVCRGKGGCMHIAELAVGNLGANGIVAGGIPIAVGSALSARMQGIDRVVVDFFGDGATNEGSLPRGAEPGGDLEAAGPVRLREQPVRHVHARVQAHGHPGHRRAGLLLRPARQVGGRQRHLPGLRGRPAGARVRANARAPAAGHQHLPHHGPLQERRQRVPDQGGGGGVAEALPHQAHEGEAAGGAPVQRRGAAGHRGQGGADHPGGPGVRGGQPGAGAGDGHRGRVRGGAAHEGDHLRPGHPRGDERGDAAGPQGVPAGGGRRASTAGPSAFRPG